MHSLSQEGNFEALGAGAFRQMSVEEALAGLMAAQLPCGPILSVEDTLVDPQVIHNEIVQRFDHPQAGTIQAARPPARFSKTPSALATWFGARGAHNSEVLAEIGYSLDEIAAFEVNGLIGS